MSVPPLHQSLPHNSNGMKSPSYPNTLPPNRMPSPPPEWLPEYVKPRPYSLSNASDINDKYKPTNKIKSFLQQVKNTVIDHTNNNYHHHHQQNHYYSNNTTSDNLSSTNNSNSLYPVLSSTISSPHNDDASSFNNLSIGKPLHRSHRRQSSKSLHTSPINCNPQYSADNLNSGGTLHVPVISAHNNTLYDHTPNYDQPIVRRSSSSNNTTHSHSHSNNHVQFYPISPPLPVPKSNNTSDMTYSSSTTNLTDNYPILQLPNNNTRNTPTVQSQLQSAPTDNNNSTGNNNNIHTNLNQSNLLGSIRTFFTGTSSTTSTQQHNNMHPNDLKPSSSTSDVSSWLHSFGIDYDQYIPSFRQNGVTGESLLTVIDDSSLHALGIDNISHRNTIMEQIKYIKSNYYRNKIIERPRSASVQYNTPSTQQSPVIQPQSATIQPRTILSDSIQSHSNTDSTTTGQECIICLDGAKCILFEPCCHICVCVECASNSELKKCPVCREPINQRKRVYM